ncbi:hypothetical protein AYO44_17295 [Planctomycetaceae bacterium SCGC AG-212-F19]|nr:hypothetical protein AYO44_17295 [Planctomycetaceae bacterium SCGC AG-212-F19]
MNAYDFVHLALHAMGGEIKGKTKLQKTVYFLGLLSKMDGDLGFDAHFYGPYSADVAGAVQRLRALGFADQTSSSMGSVDSSGFEVARYDLALTDEGRRMAEGKARANPTEWEKIKAAAERIKASKELDYMKLSIAAKTKFMLGKQKGPVPFDDLAEQAKGFGWSITRDEVREAAEFLASLGLVTIKSP